MSSSRRGLLFIISAPSGTGKTTLVERLVQVVPRLRMSRSYTSRSARAGEHDGVDYNFISREQFEAMIGEHAFLEWADVFGNYYGTGAADTEEILAAGQDVRLDVYDVSGRLVHTLVGTAAKWATSTSLAHCCMVRRRQPSATPATKACTS